MDEFLAVKHPGDVDIPEVLDAKRIIRETEAVAGIRTLGLEDGAARFLNLPFYQTGMVRKDPVGPADVAIVRALLEELAPDLVFVAGDLSDPHGTHRMCKEAIERALAEHVAAGGRRPEVWLYRGAWQEWPVTDATWLVPLSQEELRLKIQAIFKHQSQKDTRARFPGPTSASSGSGWRRGTRARRPSSTGWGWRSTSRWRPTWSIPLQLELQSVRNSSRDTSRSITSRSNASPAFTSTR